MLKNRANKNVSLKKQQQKLTEELVKTTHCKYCVSKGTFALGPSIKYSRSRGEGVREGVTVCDRGRGSKSM